MDTLLIDGEEYVRIEPNKFVKRSSMPKETPKDVKAEPAKVESAPAKAEPVKVEPAKVESAPAEVEPVKAEGWHSLRALPDLKDLSDEELKQHWDEMINSKLKQKLLVGFHNSEKEVKTIVNTTEMFISEKAYDYLAKLTGGSDKGQFKASNGYNLYGGERWSNEWRSDKLFMSQKTFRGKKVNLTTLLPAHASQITCEAVANLKVALTELSKAVAAAGDAPMAPKPDPEDLSNLQIL